MLIRNASAYMDGRFHAGMDLRIMHGVVQEIGTGLLKGLYEAELDLQGDYLLPGFVDVHIHGFRGADVMDGEAAVRHMARELYKEGVAAFLPTTMSASVDQTRVVMDGIHAVRMKPDRKAARVLGAHMEAPYLNPECCGAQKSEYLHAPDVSEWMAMIGGRVEDVRMVTLAPELPGASTMIRTITRRGVIASIGHSHATAEQVHEAASDGARHVTHLFNGQSPLHHRAPGVPCAALTDSRLYVEFIGDGIHLHPDVIRLILQAKGVEKVVAITDATAAAGLSDGDYSLGGHPVHVEHGEVRLADGTLAGTTLTMPQVLHHLIHRFGVAAERAVRVTTASPAESIGERIIGHLTVGTPAPLTRWTRGWQMHGIVDEHSAD